jgi:site-specific DNA-methyltransferase (adenine-specific)
MCKDLELPDDCEETTEGTSSNSALIALLAEPKLYYGDCLEVMKDIESGSVDMVLADPPYGTTQCKWDAIIDLELMWEQLKRIVKPNGAIVIFSAQPFTSALIMSRPKLFSYQWVWEKTQAVGHLNAYKMPMRKHEDICVFSNSGKLPLYFPQLSDKPESDIRPHSKSGLTESYGGYNQDQSKNRKVPVNKCLPRSILLFANEQKTIHPAQKPLKLMEYLTMTYTIEGETVLDFAMGSGTTGVGCKKLNRNFIGIEKDKEIFMLAKERIEAC